jgi:hypothetical protein
MNDIMAPDWAFGLLALGNAILYGAWHEYHAQNHRDAKLLAAVGGGSLLGSAAVWLQ